MTTSDGVAGGGGENGREQRKRSNNEIKDIVWTAEMECMREQRK